MDAVTRELFGLTQHPVTRFVRITCKLHAAMFNKICQYTIEQIHQSTGAADFEGTQLFDLGHRVMTYIAGYDA